jgi:glutamine synthetase
VLGLHDGTERELFKLGVPVKTRHNEVAPASTKSPRSSRAPTSPADHQQLVMTTFKRVAKKYGMACLLHEKPFAGINGSGKHVNLVARQRRQGNLLDPGRQPARQHAVPGVLRRGHPRRAQLRRPAARLRRLAGNDHRLGANEAPPAIISIFLGDQLADVFDQIAKGGATKSKGGTLNIGVDTAAPAARRIPATATAPARSPSPATASSSAPSARSQSIAGPAGGLNTIVAESLDYIATELEKGQGPTRRSSTKAVQTAAAGDHEGHTAVIFNGDGYSDAWHKEAAKRGLPNLVLISEPAIELFEKYSVFSAREMHSRYDIGLEQYAMSVNVEARLTFEMGKTMVLPAALRYQTEVALNVGALIAAQVPADPSTLEPVSGRLAALRIALAALGEAVAGGTGLDVHDAALYARDSLIPAIAAVREAADSLEGVVADDLWPLPTYQEMLHIL